MRGKWILRTRFSRSTTAVTAPLVASPKKVNRTMPSSSDTGNSGWLETVMNWVKTT